MELIKLLFRLLLLFFNPLVLIPVAVVIVVFCLKNKEYKQSAYYQSTHHPFLSVLHDKGKHGEYLTVEKSETADISLNESVSVVLQNNYEPKSDIVIDGDLSVSKAEAQNIKNALSAMEILF